jgi:hypothetical protein
VKEIRNVYNILARGTLKRSLGESCSINRITIFKQINKQINKSSDSNVDYLAQDSIERQDLVDTIMNH